MTYMKALVVQEIGKPLVLVDRDIPQPGKGQVQLEVSVGGLNPHDQRSRDWGLLIAEILPYVLAKDVVGTVTRLGEGVTAYEVGDRIVSLADGAAGALQSGLQEYAIVDVINSCKVPDNLSDDEAATLPANLNAVVIALFINLAIPAPWSSDKQTCDKLLIVGGGSNCGRLAVQVARLAGITNIVVVGGDETELETLGATHVINRHGTKEEVLRQIHDAVGDNLLHVFDTVNFPEGLGFGFDALSSQKVGKLARLIPLATVEEPMRKGHEVMDVLGNQHTHHPLLLQMWERLPEYLERGYVRAKPFTAIKSGLDAAAVDRALDGYRDGARVVKPQIHI